MVLLAAHRRNHFSQQSGDKSDQLPGRATSDWGSEELAPTTSIVFAFALEVSCRPYVFIFTEQRYNLVVNGTSTPVKNMVMFSHYQSR